MSTTDPAQPTALPVATIHFLDAMRVSVEMAEAVNEDIQKRITDIEQSINAGGHLNRQLAIRLTLPMWSFVDVTHRLRELVQQAPGLKQKLPKLQQFIRATESIEGLRHHVQHFRSGIAKMPEKSTPIWGVVSWVASTDPNRCFAFAVGSPHPNLSFYTIAIDMHQMKFAQRLILSVNNVLVDVPDVLSRIREVATVIEDWAQKNGCPPTGNPTLFQMMIDPALVAAFNRVTEPGLEP